VQIKFVNLPNEDSRQSQFEFGDPENIERSLFAFSTLLDETSGSRLSLRASEAY
jgi:hypothetical protein